jgi:hypothetical protein
MTPDADPGLERAYPYCEGWRVAGCMALLYTLLGAGGLTLIPAGCERVRQGELPIGIALVVTGLFGAPLILLAALATLMGVRDTFRPQLLRVTPTALLLPMQLRRESTPVELDERGEPKERKVPPAHPEELPFAAVRWVRREGKPNPGSDKLMIVHDLAPVTLVIEQFMMRREDFDELETVLRAAVPAAFTPASPVPPEPPAA